MSGYQGYAQQPPARTDARRSFGVVGAAIAAVGAVLLIISFTVVNWYSSSALGGSKFNDMKKIVDAADKANLAGGVAKFYFAWLAWVLLVVAVAAAVLANVPGPTSTAFRAVGVLVALAGAVGSFLAVKFVASGSYGDYLKHASIGFWLAVAGFLVIAVGAAIGPRRV